MSVRYRIARVIGISSNGKAAIDVNTIARRVSVTPLHSKSKDTLYRSFGCGLVKCTYPNKTCNECKMNYIIKTKGK